MKTSPVRKSISIAKDVFFSRPFSPPAAYPQPKMQRRVCKVYIEARGRIHLSLYGGIAIPLHPTTLSHSGLDSKLEKVLQSGSTSFKRAIDSPE